MKSKASTNPSSSEHERRLAAAAEKSAAVWQGGATVTVADGQQDECVVEAVWILPEPSVNGVAVPKLENLVLYPDGRVVRERRVGKKPHRGATATMRVVYNVLFLAVITLGTLIISGWFTWFILMPKIFPETR